MAKKIRFIRESGADTGAGLTLAQTEYFVANTLAKWRKLEPNEINFSQGFSQKVHVVSTHCFIFKSLPTRGDFCCLLITFANSLDPDQA